MRHPSPSPVVTVLLAGAIFACAILACVGVSWAASTWSGGATTASWTLAANWTGDTSPDSDDDVSFPGVGGAGYDDPSTMNAGFTVRSLQLAPGYGGTLTLQNFTLNITGTGNVLTMDRGDQIMGGNNSVIRIIGSGAGARTISVASGTATLWHLNIDPGAGRIVYLNGSFKLLGDLVINSGTLVVNGTIRLIQNCRVLGNGVLDMSPASGPIIFGDDIAFDTATSFIPSATQPIQLGLDAETTMGGTVMDMWMPGVALNNVRVDNRRLGGAIMRMVGPGPIVSGDLTMLQGNLSVPGTLTLHDDMEIGSAARFEIPTSGSGATVTFGDDGGDSLRVLGTMDLRSHSGNPARLLVWSGGEGGLDNGASIIALPGATVEIHGASSTMLFGLLSTQSPPPTGGQGLGLLNRWRFIGNPGSTPATTINLSRLRVADSAVNSPAYFPAMYPTQSTDGGNTRGWVFSTASDVPAIVTGESVTVEEASPNPFRGSTRIRLALPVPSSLRVTVYDATGRQVQVLAEGERSAGIHDVSWDGRDASGIAVASGAYFIRAVVGGVTVTRRALLLN